MFNQFQIVPFSIVAAGHCVELTNLMVMMIFEGMGEEFESVF